jgi:hypothetical protein
MNDVDLERDIELAKREFDAAVGRPEEVKAAWAKLSALVKRRGDQFAEQQASETQDSC